MALRWMQVLALALLVGAGACGDDEPAAKAQGAGGTGGNGSGGEGGEGDGGAGEGPGACADLPLPEALGEKRWREDFTIAGFMGLDGVIPSVHDVAIDPDGNLVAAGYFTWVGHQRVGPIVRMKDGAFSSEGVEWASGEVPWEIGALAWSDAGTLFAATHGQKVTPFQPDPVGTIFAEGPEGLEAIGGFVGWVRELHWFQGELWVAGEFILDDSALLHLAIWDGSSWKAPPGGGPNDPVGTLFEEDGVLWMGGLFDRIGGIDARIAGWNGSEWTGLSADFNGAIYALERDATGAWLAGGYLHQGEMPTGGGFFRHLGEGTWELVGGGLGQGYGPGVVSAIAHYQGELFVSGCFTHVGGDLSVPEAILTGQIARWTGEGWVAVEDTAPFSAWYDPQPCGPWTARQRMLVHDGLLHVAGNFNATANVASQGLVTWNGERWAPAGSAGENGVTGFVRHLAAGGEACSVYAYGPLTHGGAVHAPSRLLRWDDGWHAVGSSHPDPMVHDCDALVVDEQGRPLIGCAIWPRDGGEPRGTVFSVADGWEPLPSAETLPPIFDMGLDADGRLWVVGGLAEGFVARQDDEGHLAIIEEGFDGPVRRIAFEPPREGEGQGVVVAGEFFHVGDTPAQRIAILDEEGWNAAGPGLPSLVNAVAWGEAGLFAATAYDGLGGTHVVLGLWDGATWRDLATEANGFPPPADDAVRHDLRTLLVRGKDLVAVGQVLTDAGGQHAWHWDGTRFTAIGGGIAALAVEAVAIGPEGLWLGGGIAEVGPEGDRIPSVGVAVLEGER